MVIGGACAVSLVGFPLSRVLSLAKTVKILFFRKKEDAAALIEPLAVCVRGLRRLRLEDFERTAVRPDAALVLGDGPIGLIMAMLLRHRGLTQGAFAAGVATPPDL